MTITEVKAYTNQHLADIHRFLLSWRIRHGLNCGSGDEMTKYDIMRISKIKESSFKTSELMAQGFTTNTPSQVWKITDYGIHFLNASKFDVLGVNVENGVITLPYSKDSFALSEGQREVVLRMLLMADPTISINVRKIVILTMRMIHLNQGTWIPDNTDFCSTRSGTHDTNTPEDVKMNCPDCYPSITQERFDFFFSVFPTMAVKKKLGTVEKLAVTGMNYCLELGLIEVEKIAAEHCFIAQFTERGLRAYQLLEARDYFSTRSEFNAPDVEHQPGLIINPITQTPVTYDHEVENIIAGYLTERE